MKKAFILAIFALTIAFPAFANAQEPMQITQDSAVLGVGQSINFISTNRSKLTVKTNSSVVKVNVYGGNQVTLLGKRVGTAEVTVCDQTYDCTYIEVTVQRKNDVKFYPAKSKVTVSAGSSVTIPTKNGVDIITLSNSEAASSRLVGNAVKITGASVGNSTITVCSSNRGCFPIYVAVTKPIQRVLGIKIDENGFDYSSNNLWLNSTSVTLNVGGQLNVNSYPGTNLTAKSNSAVVRTAANGNIITLYGTYVGDAVVKICTTNNVACSSIPVKVTPAPNGNFDVSPTNLSIDAGKNAFVTAYYGGTITATSNNSYVNTTVVGNQVFVRVSSLYTSGGSALLSICSVDAHKCLPVTVTVKKTEIPPTNNGTFRTVTLGVGETKTIPFRTDLLTSFYIVNNSNSQVAEYSINNNINTIVGKRAGTATVTLCPLSPIYPCGTIGITVLNSVSCSDGSTGPLTLSDNSLVINLQQSVNVIASTCNGLSAKSDSDSAGTTVNGNIITIYGVTPGQSKVTACNRNASCASVNVKIVDSTITQPVYSPIYLP